jgi:hypothetical protein
MQVGEKLCVSTELGTQLLYVLFAIGPLVQPPSGVVPDHVLYLVYIPHHDEEMEEARMYE